MRALLFGLGLTLPLAQPALARQLQLFDPLAVMAMVVAATIAIQKRELAARPFLFPLAVALCCWLSPHPAMGQGALLRATYLAAVAWAISLLVRSEGGRGALRSGWLVGFGLTVVGTVLGLVGFGLGQVANPMIFQGGSFGSSPIPRTCSTFLNANMFCNYLILTLGWVETLPLQLVLLVSALPTLSPGLGPLTCGWTVGRSRAWKAAGILVWLGFYLISWTYPTEALHGQFRPSGRANCWRQAGSKWLEKPWVGQGPGQADLVVYWTDPDGLAGVLSDPHNTVLSLLSQGGLVLLVSVLAVFLVPTNRVNRRLQGAIWLALWLDGLTGSFEHARHIWVALGVVLAFRPDGQPSPSDTASE